MRKQTIIDFIAGTPALTVYTPTEINDMAELRGVPGCAHQSTLWSFSLQRSLFCRAA